MEQSKAAEITGSKYPYQSEEDVARHKKFEYTKDVIINVLKESQFSVSSMKTILRNVKYEILNTATL